MKKEQGLLFSYIIILIACILVVLSPSFTAWIVKELSLSIDIAPSKQACLYFVPAPSLVLQNDMVSFWVEFRNCGNQNLTEKTEIIIKNSSLAVIAQYESGYYNLSPLERKQFSTVWSAQYPLGTYFTAAKAYYDNETIELNATFNITESNITVPSIEVPPEVITAPAVGIPPAIPLMINLTVEYPSHITVVQGTNHTFFVRIANSGDVELHNLSLSLQSEIATRVNPLLVSILEPGSSAMFVVEFGIPSDLGIGDYWISCKILADEIEKIGGIMADVKALEAKEDCRRLIEEYSSMIDLLEKRIEEVRKEGKDVTAALALLEEARHELNISKELYNLGMYEECLEHLEITRKKIGQVAMMLVETSKPAVIISYETFIIIILIIIALICYIIYKKPKKKRLEKGFGIRKMLHKPRI